MSEENDHNDTMEAGQTQTQEEGELEYEEATKLNCCCSWSYGVKSVMGYGYINIGRSTVTITNLFLSVSLLKLANQEAEDKCSADVIEAGECKLYGFLPSSLLTNIAVIAGILTAIIMPIIGSILDYTSHRRTTGIIFSAILILIQAIQIGTVQKTWFAMSQLQAFAGFLYNALTLCLYSYLPEIALAEGEERMRSFSASFQIMYYVPSLIYLVLIGAISIGFQLDDILTAQISQAANTLILIFSFTSGWKLMPFVPAKQQEGSDKSNLLTSGFIKLWNTFHFLRKNHLPVLWFFFAVIFSEAAMNAFVTLAITFITEVLEGSGMDVSITFFLVLLFAIPGSLLGKFIAKKFNPKRAWILSKVLFCIVIGVASFVLKSPEDRMLVFVFDLFWGLLFGMFYCLQSLIFSMIAPKDHESAMSGFFMYSRTILTFLPPMMVTIMNENGVDLSYILVMLIPYFAVSLIFLLLMPAWDQLVQK